MAPTLWAETLQAFTADIERLNLKMERVWHSDYAKHDEVKRDITDYIVGFYNSVRLHSQDSVHHPRGQTELGRREPPRERQATQTLMTEPTG